MTDSTNPRVLADNIRVLSGVSGSQASDISALQTLITSLVTWSTNETDTGITYKGEKVYSKIVSDTTPTVETAGTAVSKYVDFISGAHPILMIGTVSSENYMSNTPTFDSGGRVVRLFYNFATEKITIVSSANSFNGNNVDILVFYTKPAPTPDILPSPDSDTRSLEEPEPEPIEEKK